MGRGLTTDLVEEARTWAVDAAARAGIDVVLLDQVWQFDQAAALLASIWGAENDNALVSKDVLRATLGQAVEAGYVATGMTRGGWYELERTEGSR